MSSAKRLTVDQTASRTMDRFDSSSELNRTWYFERFSSILDESGEESAANQSKFFTHLDRDRSSVGRALERPSSVYTYLLKPRTLVSSAFDELTGVWNTSRAKDEEDSLFFNSTTLPFDPPEAVVVSASNASASPSFLSALSSHLASNLSAHLVSPSNSSSSIADQFAVNSTFADQPVSRSDPVALLSELADHSTGLQTNYSSIQNLISDQLFLALNSSTTNVTSITDSFNQTATLGLDEQQLNASTPPFDQPQPHYNWIYILVVFLIVFGVLGKCVRPPFWRGRKGRDKSKRFRLNFIWISFEFRSNFELPRASAILCDSLHTHCRAYIVGVTQRSRSSNARKLLKG